MSYKFPHKTNGITNFSQTNWIIIYVSHKIFHFWRKKKLPIIMYLLCRHKHFYNPWISALKLKKSNNLHEMFEIYCRLRWIYARWAHSRYVWAWWPFMSRKIVDKTEVWFTHTFDMQVVLLKLQFKLMTISRWV